MRIYVSGRCSSGAGFGLARKNVQKARIGDIRKCLFIFICSFRYRQEIGVENPKTLPVVRSTVGQVRDRIASVATRFITHDTSFRRIPGIKVIDPFVRE